MVRHRLVGEIVDAYALSRGATSSTARPAGGTAQGGRGAPSGEARMSIEIANESGVEVDTDAMLGVARYALDEMGVNPLAELSRLLVDVADHGRAEPPVDGR